MITTLDDLARYIRATIPYPQSIFQLKTNAAAGAVTFIWLGTEFLVKPTLHSLEIRGNSLFITGLSTLLQSVLMSADQRGKRLDTVLETLQQAEDLAKVQQQPRLAAQSVAGARQMLERMSGRTDHVRQAA